jgi:hypothetical protein
MKVRNIAGAVVAVALVQTSAPAHAASVVVPAAQAASEGNTNFTFPFHCAGSSFSSARYQAVYRGSEVDLEDPITALSFRRDGFTAPGFTATTIPGVIISLSSTAKEPDGLSLTFAQNVGGDVTTVFSGDLTLASPASGPGSPKPFDIYVPLQTPFAFQSGSGLNLLLDVTIPTCRLTNSFDAVDSPTDGVSHVRSSTSSATVGTATTVGLVTQFHSDPADLVLRLRDNRFTVQVDWEAGDGTQGQGHALRLTEDSGYFWFFDEDNIELVVKVLDACAPPFSRFWVFAAGLTNVDTTITVTDTHRSQSKQYHSPGGQAFAPIQDTNAFDTCP